MNYRVFCVLVLVLTVSVKADLKKNCAGKPEMLTLGFDASKIRPPDAQKGKPIARVFDRYLYPESSDPKAAKSEKNADQRLLAFIWKSVSDRYIEQNKIQATQDEMDQFLKAVGWDKEDLDLPEKLSEEEQAAVKNYENQGREFAKSTVEQWKRDRMLYKRYGGAVVFQQLNPIEPIGAYRKFLEELENAGVFEIYDESDRERFWRPFRREPTSVIPPNEVDFDKPWWRQLPNANSDRSKS